MVEQKTKPNEASRRFIAVLNFDSITTFEEFQKIVYDLLTQRFRLEIVKADGIILPKYSAWQIIITSEVGV